MAKWLFKEEPAHYSFEHLELDGTAIWNGVRNNLALKNLSLIKTGDRIIYYHTGDEKAAAGIAESASDAYKDEDGFWVVKIRPVRKFKNRVPLKLIKSAERFSSTPLVRIPRLSVMPVEDDLWKFIVENGK
jgi:predicted RNA-binding protein with PUA-like domain